MRELHLNMEECGALPLPRVWEIFKHFKTSPPLHLLVRDFVGSKSEDAEQAQPVEMLPELAALPVNPNLPESVRRDIEALRKQHVS